VICADKLFVKIGLYTKIREYWADKGGDVDQSILWKSIKGVNASWSLLKHWNNDEYPIDNIIDTFQDLVNQIQSGKLIPYTDGL